MIIKYRLADLKTQAEQNPGRATEFILNRGKVDGEFVLVDESLQKELAEKFSQAPKQGRYRIADLKSGPYPWPPEAVEFMLARGKADGDHVIMDESAIRDLLQKFPRSAVTTPPARQNRFRLAELKASAAQRPAGFLDFIFSQGKIQGDVVILEGEALRTLHHKFPLKSISPKIVPGLNKFNVAELKASAPRRPDGFVEYVLAQAKIEGDFATLDEEEERKLKEKFPALWRPSPPEPSWAEIATNFTGAMTAWAKAGFRIVEREVFEKRHAICLACEFWDAQARGGLGKCKRCACTRSKLWLVSTSCPLNPPKWTKVTTPAAAQK